MSESTYFVQECPKCGRRLHVRVEYLGKGVVCQHCRGKFLASDTDPGVPATSESGLALLRWADELLGLAELRKTLPR